MKFTTKAIIISTLVLTAACQPQQTTKGKGRKASPSVQAIIDSESARRGVNNVGVDAKQTSAGVFDIEATAPEGTVLAAAHDMFQKSAYKSCKGDNYTYSIKTQENVSFYEFVGREKKQMNMPVVRGTVYCNTRTQGGAVGQMNTL
jgi:hypothetical protein